MNRSLGLSTLACSSLLILSASAHAATVFVNELHYDNDGGDVGEAVEIAGPAGTDLTGWSLVLYNGNDGGTYPAGIGLAGILPDQSNGFGALGFPVPGMQNGAPDGLALVDDAGAVVQFLSYEGSFTATDGPATGLTSMDIGVEEATGTPAGTSLQLIGSGRASGDFSWAAGLPDSFGAINAGQAFLVPLPASLVLLAPALLGLAGATRRHPGR